MVALVRDPRLGNAVLCSYDGLLGNRVVCRSLLERRLNWRFYADPRIHAAGLLVFSLAVSLLGGCYWGFYMWKFYESKCRHAETEIKS